MIPGNSEGSQEAWINIKIDNGKGVMTIVQE